MKCIRVIRIRVIRVIFMFCAICLITYFHYKYLMYTISQKNGAPRRSCPIATKIGGCQEQTLKTNDENFWTIQLFIFEFERYKREEIIKALIQFCPGCKLPFGWCPAEYRVKLSPTVELNSRCSVTIAITFS